jgi:hypothetical protein
MTWNLFLDDERNPEDVTWAPWQVREKYRNEKWVICRNLYEVVIAVRTRGMPSYISFDHDLGQDEPTGHDVAKHIVDWDMNDKHYPLPDNFDFYVHSQNPIGKANIEGLLNNYLRIINADRI